jgi:hypothetical protein
MAGVAFDAWNRSVGRVPDPGGYRLLTTDPGQWSAMFIGAHEWYHPCFGLPPNPHLGISSRFSLSPPGGDGLKPFRLDRCEKGVLPAGPRVVPTLGLKPQALWLHANSAPTAIENLRTVASPQRWPHGRGLVSAVSTSVRKRRMVSEGIKYWMPPFFFGGRITRSPPRAACCSRKARLSPG